MTDNLNDFFSDNAQWVDDTSAVLRPSMPAMPHPNRRKSRTRHASTTVSSKRRRRYVTNHRRCRSVIVLDRSSAASSACARLKHLAGR